MAIVKYSVTILIVHMCIQFACCELNPKSSVQTADAVPKDELVFAHIIYRHGNRSILYTYENDPYKNESFWPGGYGMLTNAGKRRQYELGKYLRRRYKKLIGPQFSTENVYIRSSDTDRTLMSALANAAAWFPPSGSQIWKSSLRWQPVPIHTVPLNEDYLVYQSVPCLRGVEELKEYMESPRIQAENVKYQKFFEFLERNSGSTVRSIKDAALLYDPLLIESFRGLRLPRWANEVVRTKMDLLEHFLALNFAGMTKSTEMKKAKAGYLINEIFERFKNKTLSLLSPDRKVWVYSAHDNTIVNTLNALNLYDMRIPPFAASLHFEMYRRANSSNYYVQLFYRRDEFEDVPPLKFRKCGTKCTLDELYQMYANILPDESESYESLCKV